jgi:hypothetical protein
MGKVVSVLKSIVLFPIKLVYIGFFVAICLLLLKILYLPDLELFAKKLPGELDIYTEYTRNQAMINRIIKQQEPLPREHFHVTDKHLERLASEPPFCMTCHGIYPHIKDIKSISYLNLHVGFMACEVCHVRKDAENPGMYFAWVEDDTGNISMWADGRYGKYKAKIIPVRKRLGVVLRFDKLTGRRFAKMYLELKAGQHPPERQEQEAGKIHKENLSKKAVTCLECHQQNGYLPLKLLGFPRYRINQLTSSEVSRMLGNYKTFYMPRMLKSPN